MTNLYSVAVVFVVHLENPMQLVSGRGGCCNDDCEHHHDYDCDDDDREDDVGGDCDCDDDINCDDDEQTETLINFFVFFKLKIRIG